MFKVCLACGTLVLHTSAAAVQLCDILFFIRVIHFWSGSGGSPSGKAIWNVLLPGGLLTTEAMSVERFTTRMDIINFWVSSSILD